MNVLFYKVAQEGGRHSQEENRQREGPLDVAFGAADVGGDFLAKNRPTVNCSDGAVQEQRGDGSAQPFVFR